jgi:molybdopterin biosynthesis enzyme
MLRYEEAIAIVHGVVSDALSTEDGNRSERVPLGQAVGRVAAVRVSLEHPVPATPTSIKDGYAVRSAETPGTLYLNADSVFAAAQPDVDISASDVESHTAVYIATGGCLPRFADCVVEIERAQVLVGQDGRKSIKVDDKMSPLEDVRAPGSDAKVSMLHA